MLDKGELVVKYGSYMFILELNILTNTLAVRSLDMFGFHSPRNHTNLNAIEHIFLYAIHAASKVRPLHYITLHYYMTLHQNIVLHHLKLHCVTLQGNIDIHTCYSTLHGATFCHISPRYSTLRYLAPLYTDLWYSTLH